jgi:hypothetical protein
VQALLDRCARLKVAVALASKTARVALALVAKRNVYRRAAAPAA